MPDTELIRAKIDGLANLVGGLSTSVDNLATTTARTRKWTAALAVLATVTAITVIATVVALVRVNHANDRATRIAEYQASSCVAGNEARTAQRDLWAYVIHFSEANSKRPLTAQDRKALTALQTHVNTVFANRDCAAARR